MMHVLADFHFIRPGWLLLLPLSVGVWWLWRRHADPLRGWREQMDANLLSALIVRPGAASQDSARWLLAGWLLAALAVAGPTWRLEPNPFADDATPLMILLKADVSMDRADLEPSRIERAQLKIADLAKARMGQPLGLMAYAGSAHLVLPPTRDTAIVARMAAEVSPAIMPVPGDRLDLALGEATRLLAEGKQGGSILVLADAVDMDPVSLEAGGSKGSFPVQFLSMAAPGLSPNESLHAAARVLKATVELLAVDDSDIAAIVRKAARAPIAQVGEASGRWQEAGYWLLPAVVLMVLLSFRREANEEAPA